MVATNTQQKLKSIARWLVAAVVVIGLGFAVRQAAEQWHAESAKLHQRIEVIESRMSKTLDGRILHELQQTRQSLLESLPIIRNLNWPRIAMAAMFYAIALVPPGFLLHRAIIGLGGSPRITTAIAAQLLGHAGKYVPGKAMVIVLRAGAMSIDGIDPLTTTIAVFVETFIVMAVGATVAGLIVCTLPVPIWIMMTAFLFALLASLPTLPPILKRAAAKVSQVDVRELNSRIGFGLIARGWALALTSWITIGASFALLVSSIPSTHSAPPAIELFATATAAVSLAMVVGFASLLPGGAGVRELVLTTVLSVSLGTAHGLLAAIAHRVLSIIVESLLATGSWIWLRYTVAKQRC